MNILGLKFKIQDSRGYTLIEMLAAIIVFAILGGIIAMIFTSSLRGSNKANTETEVRQNGNYALSQMTKVIAYSNDFNGISESGSSYIGSCYSEDEDLSLTEYHFLKVLDFDGNETVFTCGYPLALDGEPQIASNGASLIDNDINGAVKADYCNIYCSQSSYFSSPVIKIRFQLSQASKDSFYEHRANVSFETTVVMRNIGR